MKLYACYTPSHSPLFKHHFLPSIREEFRGQLRDCQTLFETFREIPQRSTSGAFESPGFQATCLDKVDSILEALKAETEPFLFSDVDVRFYGPVVYDLLKCLGDADMAFQWDGPRGKECTGFMVLRAPSAKLLRFWGNVRNRMVDHDLMDQDAVHSELEFDRVNGTAEISKVILPERYWTYGRCDKQWQPGDQVNPPADLIVHHANWTTGVENKLKLLDAVKATMDKYNRGDTVTPPPRIYGPKLPHLASFGNHHWGGRRVLYTSPIEAEDLSPVVAAGRARETAPCNALKSHERTFTLDEVHRIIEDERNKLAVWHNPMPLALVLQFWNGDKHEACELARLLADIEPHKRSDVGFVFARQSNCPLDEEIYETQLYVGAKFHVADLEASAPEWKKYPGVCADAWASAAKKLSDAYLDGRLPYHSAFFFEADGGPLPPLRCWIDRLKNAHQETLSFGKQFTGARMREKDHLNGTLLMALRAIVDIPSLQRCPASEAWDIFHSNVIVRESHPTNIIRNDYGISLSEQQFHHFGRESSWITSIKDGSHHHWARQLLAKERRDKERLKR